jgi:hypothetical protein
MPNAGSRKMVWMCNLNSLLCECVPLCECLYVVCTDIDTHTHTDKHTHTHTHPPLFFRERNECHAANHIGTKRGARTTASLAVCRSAVAVSPDAVSLPKPVQKDSAASTAAGRRCVSTRSARPRPTIRRRASAHARPAIDSSTAYLVRQQQHTC